MTDLVSMYGRSKVGASPYSFSLFSLSGDSENDPILNINPMELSDIDAGIQVLYAITQLAPGITWGDLYDARNGNRVSGWLTDLGKKVGTGFSDIGDKVGSWAGDAIRLFSDDEVSAALQKYGTAYATGGASLGAEGMLQQMGGGKEGGFNLDSILGMLGGIGKDSKNQANKAGFSSDFSNISPKAWMISGGVFGGLLLILLVATKK